MQPLHLRLRHARSVHGAYGTDWTDDVAQTLACSMVICRLDYCNAFLGRKKNNVDIRRAPYLFSPADVSPFYSQRRYADVLLLLVPSA